MASFAGTLQRIETTLRQHAQAIVALNAAHGELLPTTTFETFRGATLVEVRSLIANSEATNLLIQQDEDRVRTRMKEINGMVLEIRQNMPVPRSPIPQQAEHFQTGTPPSVSPFGPNPGRVTPAFQSPLPTYKSQSPFQPAAAAPPTQAPNSWGAAPTATAEPPDWWAAGRADAPAPTDASNPWATYNGGCHQINAEAPNHLSVGLTWVIDREAVTKELKAFDGSGLTYRAWRRRVRDHLIGGPRSHPQWATLLNLIEKETTPLTREKQVHGVQGIQVDLVCLSLQV